MLERFFRRHATAHVYEGEPREFSGDAGALSDRLAMNNGRVPPLYGRSELTRGEDGTPHETR
jgi:hypothetical protein